MLLAAHINREAFSLFMAWIPVRSGNPSEPSGDFRDHGTQGEQEGIKRCRRARGVDILITEGTVPGRERGPEGKAPC